MNLKLRVISLEKEWEYFVQNFTGHVDTVRCLEITQKGFAINTKTIDEEKIIPSNPRQLRKLIENRKIVHFKSVFPLHKLISIYVYVLQIFYIKK